MSKEREALELIASQNFDGADDRAIAIMASLLVHKAKEALAQPAQEPVTELLYQSKENFERNFGKSLVADWVYHDVADLLGELVAQPAQEPVKDIGIERDERVFARIAAMREGKDFTISKPWVGLTDECRKQLIQEGWSAYIAGIDDGKTFGEWMSVATEAKLKELNT